MSSPLLVDRDETLLVPLEGKPDVDGNVPEVFRTGCYVVCPALANMLNDRPDDDHLVTKKGCDIPVATRADNIPALWSGKRSVLMQAKVNGQKRIYRIKGVAFNPSKPEVQHYDDTSHEIWGAQPAYSAQFERKMSNRFNKVLESEGITPVMKHKGFWRYSTKVGREKLTASIVEVQGDTRVDELFMVLEGWLPYKYDTFEERRCQEYNFQSLAYQIGERIGQLKKLMDKNNQTWSSTSSRSNAHIGNVVIYRKDDMLNVGLVDFDASCDTDDLSITAIKDLQKKEYDRLITSFLHGEILSPRAIGYTRRNISSLLSCYEIKNGLADGFAKGYHSRLKNFSGISAKSFYDIIDKLKSPPSVGLDLLINSKYKV